MVHTAFIFANVHDNCLYFQFTCENFSSEEKAKEIEVRKYDITSEPVVQVALEKYSSFHLKATATVIKSMLLFII